MGLAFVNRLDFAKPFTFRRASLQVDVPPCSLWWLLRLAGHTGSIGRKVTTFNRTASLFDRLPPGGCNPEANDLNRLGARLHGLAFCRCKFGANEAADHIAIEPMDAHKQRLGSAMRAAAE
jgi:hypothetical protein